MAAGVASGVVETVFSSTCDGTVIMCHTTLAHKAVAKARADDTAIQKRRRPPAMFDVLVKNDDPIKGAASLSLLSLPLVPYDDVLDMMKNANPNTVQCNANTINKRLQDGYLYVDFLLLAPILNDSE